MPVGTAEWFVLVQAPELLVPRVIKVYLEIQAFSPLFCHVPVSQ